MSRRILHRDSHRSPAARSRPTAHARVTLTATPSQPDLAVPSRRNETAAASPQLTSTASPIVPSHRASNDRTSARAILGTPMPCLATALHNESPWPFVTARPTVVTIRSSHKELGEGKAILPMGDDNWSPRLRDSINLADVRRLAPMQDASRPAIHRVRAGSRTGTSRRRGGTASEERTLMMNRKMKRLAIPVGRR